MSAYITNNLNARASAATHSVFAARNSRSGSHFRLLALLLGLSLGCGLPSTVSPFHVIRLVLRLLVLVEVELEGVKLTFS